MTITVRATMRVHSGRGEEFAELVTALVEATCDETGTLRYGWFESEDPDEYVVLEEYTDADAAIAHNMQCSALLERVPEVAEMTSAHLHGVLGPDLTAWIADRPQAHAHPPMRHL
ncbi:MAG: putative quinol monooxygenase [Pseudonocardiaceae bacterium]